MILLDTNVLSEVMKPSPSPRVMRWMAKQPALDLFTTAISHAEILYGMELLPKGKRRSALQVQAESMFEEDFADRILPFDSDAARWFARIVAGRRSMGRPTREFDAAIAAIARSRSAALATRNTRDFDDCGVALLNPWAYE
jgi:predicted nucleic acid-binding protein